MWHSLANIEHHHFKFEAHRRPGDIHVHFFGADAFSFGEGVQLADGDVMQCDFDGFGQPLRNPVRIAGGADTLVAVRQEGVKEISWQAEAPAPLRSTRLSSTSAPDCC